MNVDLLKSKIGDYARHRDSEADKYAEMTAKRAEPSTQNRFANGRKMMFSIWMMQGYINL